MEHGYELKYKNGVGGELIYKFSDDIDIHSLKDNLEYFLLGCSWTPRLVKQLFNAELGNDAVFILNTENDD